MLLNNLHLLNELRPKGIGGRDCMILASINHSNIETIITHDKNFLELIDFNRIESVFNPPFELPKGTKFDYELFKNKLDLILKLKKKLNL